jgi:PAS domain S-box-containing protein
MRRTQSKAALFHPIFPAHDSMDDITPASTNILQNIAPMLFGGDTGEIVRQTDWSVTPLGDYATWPQSLRSTLSLVLNSKNIAALYWGPEQWLLYNDAYSHALGDRHPWAFGRPFKEALSDIAPVLGPQVEQVLATGQGFALENVGMTMHRYGKKEATYWTYSFSPIQGEEGGFAGVLLFANETTKQIKAEKIASQARQRHQRSLDNMPGFTAIVKSQDYVFEYANKTFVDFARGQEILGRPLFDIFPEFAQSRLHAIIDKVFNDGAAFSEQFMPFELAGAKEIGFFNVHYEPILDDEECVEGIILGGYEVTDQHRATAALLKMNAHLEEQVAERLQDRNALWMLSSDIMLRCNFEGTIIATNPAWSSVLGWTEAELIGSKIFDFIHPEDIAHTIAGAHDSSIGTHYQRFDNRYRHRDGSYRWISWSTRPEDNLINAVGRDITRDKEQASELEAMQNALRQSQKMEAVGQLTGGLAHDFNNLLSGITGALQLMQIRMQQGRFNEFDRYITMAQGASKRAAALTHRLLAFSRQQTLLPKPTNVNRLVAEMHELIQRTVGPGTPVEVVEASDVWTALVDASQLKNALLNLCINARDAMPNGGRITIETANKWIDERAARQQSMAQGQYLSLAVTDTGTGMLKEVISRAFDPFFTTKPIGKGTGLGLSMIYGFAQQSGGQVRIYSEVGEGTTVCLYLPRHYGDSSDEIASDQIATLKRSDQVATVLIVDDEPTVRMLLIEVLDDLGYAWIEAEDSAVGLRLLQSDARIDLLISDVGLPGGMNGRQMADAGRLSRSDLKVLFITGYAENAVLNNGFLEPGMAVLTKPFSIEAIANRIQSMVEEGEHS